MCLNGFKKSKVAPGPDKLRGNILAAWFDKSEGLPIWITQRPKKAKVKAKDSQSH